MVTTNVIHQDVVVTFMNFSSLASIRELGPFISATLGASKEIKFSYVLFMKIKSISLELSLEETTT